MVTRQEEQDRWVRQETVTVSSILEKEPGEEADTEDDEDTVDEREMREDTDVTEKDLGTTEGEDLDLLSRLLELEGWDLNDKEKEKKLS